MNAAYAAPRVQHAWAIYGRSDGWREASYIGVFWFGTAPPEWQAGCTVALFKTRAAARAKLPEVQRTLPHARVERVVVTIQEWENTKGLVYGPPRRSKRRKR